MRSPFSTLGLFAIIESGQTGALTGASSRAEDPAIRGAFVISGSAERAIPWEDEYLHHGTSFLMVEAVDTVHSSVTEVLAREGVDLNTTVRPKFTARFKRRSHVGAFLAHRRVWGIVALMRPDALYLVLEDDVVVEDVRRVLRTYRPPDPGLGLISVANVSAGGAGYAGAYCLRPSAARVLLRSMYQAYVRGPDGRISAVHWERPTIVMPVDMWLAYEGGRQVPYAQDRQIRYSAKMKEVDKLPLVRRRV